MIKTDAVHALDDHMPALAEVAYSLSEGASGHIMEMLRSMYKDPHYAVVREYLSNALDAHTVAGTSELVEISTPGKFNPNLIIRDYGVGLGREDSELLFTYGESGHGKRDTNSQLGHFGIGGKCGFAIAPSLSFHTYKDGVECVWTCYLDKQGVGRAKLVSHGATDGRDGVKVAIPVHPENFATCSAAVDKATKALDCSVIVDGAARTPLEAFAREEDFFIKDKTADGWRMWVTPGNSYRPDVKVCVGGFLYTVGSLNVPSHTVWPSARATIHVDVPVGWLSVTPSRDSLLFDDVTKQRLAALVTYLHTDYSRVIRAYIDRADTPLDAIDRYRRIYPAVPNRNTRSFMWRGTEVDVLRSVAVEGVYRAVPRASGVTGAPFAMEFRISGRRSTRKLQQLRIDSFLATSARGAYFQGGVLSMAPRVEIALIKAAVGTTMRRVRSAVNKLNATDRGLVYIVGPSERLDALTRGINGEYLKDFAKHTIVIPEVSVRVAKPKGTLRVFTGRDGLGTYGAKYAKPSSYWEKVDKVPSKCNVAWVPSHACRVILPSLPTALFESISTQAPNHKLCMLVDALRLVDSTFTVVTGGEQPPAGAVTFREAVDKIAQDAVDGKRRGVVSLAALALFIGYAYGATWFRTLLKHHDSRVEVLANTRTITPLHKLFKAADKLAPCALPWTSEKLLVRLFISQYVSISRDKNTSEHPNAVEATTDALRALVKQVEAYIPIIGMELDGTKLAAITSMMCALDKTWKRKQKGEA